MRGNILLFTFAVALLPLSWIFIKNEDTGTSSYEKTLIVMRKIGHEILLQAGDSTSRVLPVENPEPSTFIIKFENSFFFVPDSLVTSVHRQLQASSVPPQYQVEVIDCSDSKKVFYSYEVSKSLEENNIHCKGRKQPMGCYFIKIKFTETQFSAFTNNYLKVLTVPMMILLLVIGWKRAHKNKTSDFPLEEMENENAISIGKLQFLPEKQILKVGRKRIELSSKESKLLKVFALKLNEIIDRDQLLKEVWEDDGVFVGRSLDVFVSKLRKKLQADPLVRIVNIHGKGYKLEVGED